MKPGNAEKEREVIMSNKLRNREKLSMILISCAICEKMFFICIETFFVSFVYMYIELWRDGTIGVLSFHSVYQKRYFCTLVL